MRDSFWYIKNCNLFERVNLDDVKWLESRSKMRKLKRGEPVFLPSQLETPILLVASGRIKTCHLTPEGKQTILGFIEPGEIFGELALIGGDARGEHAEAAEATTLVAFEVNDLQAILHKYSSVSFGITKLIGMRRQRIERRLKNLLFRSNRERIIHLLLELSETYGVQSAEGIQLGIKLSHQEIASLIGSTRETVTVVLGQIQLEGKIKTARRKIVIRDLQALADEVHESVKLPVPKPLNQPPITTQSVRRATVPVKNPGLYST